MTLMASVQLEPCVLYAAANCLRDRAIALRERASDVVDDDPRLARHMIASARASDERAGKIEDALRRAVIKVDT
jgi:hypothetical protein